VVFDRDFGGLPKGFFGSEWYGWKFYNVLYTMKPSSTANSFSNPLKNCLEVKLSKCEENPPIATVFGEFISNDKTCA
jgi:hypothetical protein